MREYLEISYSRKSENFGAGGENDIVLKDSDSIVPNVHICDATF